MKGLQSLWKFEQQAHENRFNTLADCALKMANDGNNMAEAVRCLLWADTDVLSDLFAWNAGPGTYPHLWREAGAVAAKFDFLSRFIGHDMEDDGDCGVAWLRYATRQEHGLFRFCEPGTPHAWEVIVHDRETICDSYYKEASLTYERLISLVEFHENRAEAINQRLRSLEVDFDPSYEQAPDIDAPTATIRRWMITNNIRPLHHGTRRVA